jgi:hypothetical protein
MVKNQNTTELLLFLVAQDKKSDTFGVFHLAPAWRKKIFNSREAT